MNICDICRVLLNHTHMRGSLRLCDECAAEYDYEDRQDRKSVV